MDILSTPTGPIKEAQDLAAAAFGADATWFLVNGSTVGIHAAIMACCGPSDVLIVARNCHMSAFSGMVLAGMLCGTMVAIHAPVCIEAGSTRE